MFHPIASRVRAVTTPRVAVLVLASGILAAGFASPSQAQNDRGRGPPQKYERSYRRDAPRNYGYDHGPNFYDSAPPVIYAPPAYYQQPGPVLMLNIPLFR
jgi:hypothetical protein